MEELEGKRLTTAFAGPCDAASATAARPVATDRPGLTLAATILGSSVAFIDGSVVNVALPALAHDLGAGPSELTWAINAYLLPLGALMLLGGALGDHFGRRRLFLAGLTLFTLASVVCAAAPTFSALLAGRGLQGLGAALLMPNSLAILGGAFTGEARGRAIGTWAAVGALAGALGPILGGWLVDVVGWRTIFLLNPPIAACAAFLALALRRREQGGAPRCLARLGWRDARDGRPRPAHLGPDHGRGRCRIRHLASQRSRRDAAGRLHLAGTPSRRPRDHAARHVRHPDLRRANPSDLLPLRRTWWPARYCCRSC